MLLTGKCLVRTAFLLILSYGSIEAACTKPSDPGNGTVQVNGNNPKIATFSCNQNYDLIGNTTFECSVDSWLGDFPTCSLNLNGSNSQNMNGTGGDGGDGGTGGNGGNGTNGGAGNENQDCPTPSDVENGAFPGGSNGTGYPHDSSVSYTCNGDQFKMTGEDTITCNTGSWEGDLPTCDPIMCDEIPAVTNGELGNATAGAELAAQPLGYGAVVALQCKDGYKPPTDAAMGVKCETDGWNATLPTMCEAITCPALTAPTGGSLTPPGSDPRPFNQEVTLTCEPGYDLVDVAKVKCVKSGWNATLGTCTPKHCDALGSVVNGELDSTQTVYKTSLKVKCIPGYVPAPNKAIACKADQTWSGPLPLCERAVCVPVDQLVPNLVPNVTMRQFQQAVTLTCLRRYRHKGVQVATCLETAGGVIWKPSLTNGDTECIRECLEEDAEDCLRDFVRSVPEKWSMLPEKLSRNQMEWDEKCSALATTSACLKSRNCDAPVPLSTFYNVKYVCDHRTSVTLDGILCVNSTMRWQLGTGCKKHKNNLMTKNIDGKNYCYMHKLLKDCLKLMVSQHCSASASDYFSGYIQSIDHLPLIYCSGCSSTKAVGLMTFLIAIATMVKLL